jgi:hypothetical protein
MTTVIRLYLALHMDNEITRIRDQVANCRWHYAE